MVAVMTASPLRSCARITARVCAAVAALSRSGNSVLDALCSSGARAAPPFRCRRISRAHRPAPWASRAESAVAIDWPSSTSLVPPPLQRVAQAPQLAVAERPARARSVNVSSVALGAHLERLAAARLRARAAHRPHCRFRGAPPPRSAGAGEARRAAARRSARRRRSGSRPSRARPSGDASLRVASASTASIASRCSVLAVGSSRMVKPGATSASSGKALQQAFAERVDGLHLEPARRLDGGREQGARALDLRRRWLAGGELGEHVCELCLVHRHPLRQRVVDALRHLGRSGLGVGEGENALGDGAGEHEPQRAQRQHVRLAGAGVGAHPSGCRRIGGVALGLVRAFEVGGVRRHGSTSSSSATAHSATRARCA